MVTGVAVYGGFAGTENALNQRDWTTNVTILSGDIGTTGDASDNSYHVVTGASNATLDGFTVTAGNANGTSPCNSGGGMYNQSTSPTVANVTFSGNSANDGGGMYHNPSNPALTEVTFNGTTAGTVGGWMDNGSSSPTLMYVTFSDNSGGSGGGMYSNSGNPTLTDVTFNGNTAGGGGGGGMNNDASSPTLTNVTFSDNSTTFVGGGMENYEGPSTLTNVTFSGNSATSAGGAMYNSYSSPLIRNTIFWGNPSPTGNQFDNAVDYVSNPSLSYCVVQGGYPNDLNNISADPLLGTLGNYGGYTQTIPLLPGSSAIDAGYASYCTSGSDQRGLDYVGNYDIGAFESQGFSLTISGGNNQSTPSNAAFPIPLQVGVTALNAVEPVNGGQVVFTAPASGASATLSVNPATIASGSASLSATANGSVGSYQVTASAAGAGSVAFDLENILFTIFLPLVLR